MKTMWALLTICTVALIGPVAVTGDPIDELSTRLIAIQKEIVDAINKCRRNVKPTGTNILKVEWKIEAADTALLYSQTCRMNHSIVNQRTLPSGCKCGENLYMSSDPVSWTEVIEAFCNESKDLIFGVGPKAAYLKVGHYTQQVWYGSYMVGAAVSYCPNHPTFHYFYVVHQCPEGNVGKIGQYCPYKVGETCALCKGKCDNGLCTNSCDCGSEPINCGDYRNFCKMLPSFQNTCPLTCKCTNGEIY